MKKHHFKSHSVMAAMCAILTLASCGSDIELTDAQSPVKGEYKVTFTASQEGSATRTAIDADDATKVIWQPGDAITVFDGNNQNCTFEFAKYAKINGETVKTIGEFEGTITVTEPKRYCAVYPAAEGAEITEENDMISDAPTADAPASNYIITGLMLPVEQVATPGGFDPQAAIMTACNNNADNIKNESEDLSLGEFKHVCAFVKITTTEAYDKITFTANGGDSIAGNFSAKVGADGISEVIPTTIITETDGTAGDNGASDVIRTFPSSTVSLVPAVEGTKIAPGTYFIAILPGTLEKGFTMSCTSVDEESSEVTTMLRSFKGSTGAFSRCNVVNMGTVNATDWTRVTQKYVDLGLSVKWATCNVGASQPQEYGDYFAWGETEGNNSGKTIFDWPTYKWCEGSETTLTKYNTNDEYGFVDDKITLDASDDAAHINWGSAWRMPTPSEQQELRNTCYWEWTDSYKSSGIAGYIVYKAKSDADKGIKKNNYNNATTTMSYTTNDTHVFLPSAGYYDRDSYRKAGDCGSYWSSNESNESNPPQLTAWCLGWDSNYVQIPNIDRCCGQSVRPVLAE